MSMFYDAYFLSTQHRIIFVIHPINHVIVDCIIMFCFNMISDTGSALIWGETPWLPEIWIFILVLGLDMYFLLLFELTTVTLKSIVKTYGAIGGSVDVKNVVTN